MGQSKIFCFLLLLSSPQLVTSCNTGEYRANEICCTMCPSGTHVLRHCTLITSTTCGPCVPGSYMDRPNGMEECLSCKSCDADAGFKSIEECTYTMDTVCDCKEGYYCTQKGDKGCQNCRKQIQRNAYESTDDKGFNKLIQPGSKASHAVLKENIIKAIGETHSQKTSTGVHPPSKKKLASQLEEKL
ncbi:tumor necrosis factor receptor superfamily member 14-like isoform X2 [Callorhinchus milii]|uniref:tumor necrosis factor receptor superfamily member 14-like isoform X2 n=1 Tax=Callorhinchus milii TaxID=7868 RepID=UPI0004573F9B|nr:tumor necrosis factor receptor superfamily member 14-like isoform X2 [Callorhinchus milii]|eukprot:gi/632977603/ref/XP_007905439.1/ PREDICTED: tumor necrosis factor receptor superfamily member 23-like isoform X2 [Callorhinchus milii]